MYLRLEITHEEYDEPINCVVKIKAEDYDDFVNYAFTRWLEHKLENFYYGLKYDSVKIVEQLDTYDDKDCKLYDLSNCNPRCNEQHIAFKLMLQSERIIKHSTNIEQDLMTFIKDNDKDIRECRDCPRYNVFMHMFAHNDDKIPFSVTKYVLDNYTDVLEECQGGNYRVAGFDFLLGQKFTLEQVQYIFTNFYNSIIKFNGLRESVLEPLIYVNRDDTQIISYIINHYPEVFCRINLLNETEKCKYHKQYVKLYERRLAQIRNLEPLELEE